MDARRWQRVDELLDDLLELPPEARERVVIERCGDDEELRIEVEKLLSAHDRSENFIEEPAIVLAAQLLDHTASPGSQIGPYRIVSLLGVGGMGKVYLAEDSRLARRVALKVLPFPFVVDFERVRRFEKEAQAASALNHPNIITIYDIGQAESIHYIAIEYVEGKTLRELLKDGALPLDQAIDVTIQIADALVAAHAAGITHRDIKPENIVLRNDGYVKVLDFGLAKLNSSQPGKSLSLSSNTDSGIIAGTVKYMSPEQALGHPTDSRTDLWSVGIVFYEMVSGCAPFDGETAAAVFDATLNHEPLPLSEVANDIPAEVEIIVSRALEKDSDLRYQTAADFRADLLRLQPTLQPKRSKMLRAFTRLRRPDARKVYGPAIFAYASVALLVLVVLSWQLFKRPASIAVEKGPDWTSAKSVQLTNTAGPEFFPNLAVDGRSFIYASRASGNWDIYWQRVGGKNPVNLTKDSAADETQPAYSPDGNFIAFRSERTPSGIYIMEATSENVRRVSDFGFSPAWSPDGKELVVSIATPEVSVRSSIPSALWIINVESGVKRLLTEGDAVQPSWSPNGDRIAYWGLRPGGGQRDIWTIPSRGGDPVAVTDDLAPDWNPSWSPDGMHLYFASDRGGSMNFWRVALDEKTGKTFGEPEAVTTPSGYSEHISFSRNGTEIAYVQKTETQNLFRVGFNPARGETTGPPSAVTNGSDYITDPDLSPDDQWLVYSSQGSRQEDILVINIDGSNQRRLTSDPYNDRAPQWSPDGSRIAFYSDRTGRYEIWVINVDGSGLQQLTFTSGPSAVYPIWSPDGVRILFKQFGLLPFIFDQSKPWVGQTPRQLKPPIEQTDSFWPFSWSSDGQLLAGTWVNDAKETVRIYNLQTETYEQVTDFGTEPAWLNDNRRLMFRSEGRLYVADAMTKKSREVLSLNPHEIRSFCVSKDNTVYYTLRRTEADIWLLSRDSTRK
jgi:Tol biopolymer transport system component